MTSARISSPLARLLLVAACALGLAGCASSPGSMNLLSHDQQRDFSQTFTRAYFSRDDAGEYDIVLVSEPDAQPHDASKTAPRTIPRQFLHIRVFWAAMTSRIDHSPGDNASLQWLMLGDGPSAGALEYRGSGIVLVSQSSNTIKVTVRRAWMKAASQNGDMVDPLGQCTMEGTARATGDPQQLKVLVARMKDVDTISAPERAAAQQAAQPSRMSVNP